MPTDMSMDHWSLTGMPKPLTSMLAAVVAIHERQIGRWVQQKHLASPLAHGLRQALWVCWIGAGPYGWNDRESVDEALRAGKTIASKEGGLAYFTCPGLLPSVQGAFVHRFAVNQQ